MPIVVRRSQRVDGGGEADHGLGHGLAGGVGVEATVEGVALGQEWSQPARIGTGTGRGETPELRMEEVATDGVDGRLAQEEAAFPPVEVDTRERNRRDGEEAPVLLGAGGWQLERRRRQTQVGVGGGRGEMAGQPMQGVLEAGTVQMDDQIDGAAAAHPAAPVHEFGAVDREDPLRRMPLVPVGRIASSPPERKDRRQGDGSPGVSLLSQGLAVDRRH